jgi:hypothetical protein
MTPINVAQLTDALIALFDPLVQAIDDADSALALLKDMGYQPPSGIRFLDDFSPLFGALLNVADQADDLLRGDTDPDYLALFKSLIDAIQDIIKLIRDVGTALQTNFSADFLAATGMVEGFPRQLADYLLVKMLERQYPVLHASLLVTGIIDQRQVTTAATPFNTPYQKRVIRWEKLGDYLSDPLPSMQEAYGWNTASFDYDDLIGNIHHFGQSIRFFSSPANPNPDTLQALNGGTDVVTDDNAGKLSILKFPLLPVLDALIGAEVYPVLDATKANVAGLGLGLYFDPSGGLSYPITDELSLGIKYTGAGPLDAGVLILPNQPLRVVSNVFGGSGPQVDLSFFVPEFSYANTDQKTLLFDTSIGAKLEFASWALRAGALANLAGLYAETDLKGATLTIGAGQGDGFLQAILPSQPMALDFDLTVGFSSKTGLYFGGGLGLEVKLPTHISIGPIALQAITVVLKPADGKIPLTLGADISANIGPLAIVVQNMGAAVTLSFPPSHDGNLGPMQVDLGFKPPSGAGLSIDAAGLVGGGFLDHDDVKKEYSGLLDLAFQSYKLTAFGLITTVLPTGPGYSLVAMVEADFPPIELGLGFALTGAGGLLGANRTAKVDALRAALAAHTLSNLLFPKNPVANAPQLLTELDTLFPAAADRFLFGPLLHIEWGAPALLTLDLALVLELPDPVRLVVIAELAVTLPDPSDKLIEIHVSALGIIDFGASTASLDAVLHDSRLMQFTLHGAMALRVVWSGQKVFLLAVGGVHPKFQPPPGFPKLDRVGISMASGHIAKLNLDGYLAVTSNTLQIGAYVDLAVGVDGFGISGFLSFDTLIQRHPFHFDGDISGGVALTAGGEDIMALRLDGSLSGPGPWHAAGSVSFDVLWWTVTKSFSETFGDTADGPPPAQVDVGQLLRAALADAHNFSASNPPEAPALVTLKAPTMPATTVLAHPGAALAVHQTVVPLGITISQYGGAPPLGEARFDITSVTADGAAQPSVPVLDDFVPGQYLELSDDEKLARPSFEQMAAGALLQGATSYATPMTRTVAYETLYVDTPDGPTREDTGVPAPLPLGVLVGVLLEGAAGNSVLARSGAQRFAAARFPMMPAAIDYLVATADQFVPAGVGAAAGLTYSQAQQTLAAEVALHPERAGTLLVAPRFEVAV